MGIRASDEKEQQRTATNRDLNDALMEAAGLREKSRTARSGNDESWSQFRAALRRAEALAGSPLADPSLVGRARGLQAELKQDEADRRMIARLEEIRLSKADLPVIPIPDMRSPYEAAFKEYGLPVFDLDVEEAARRIAASPIRDSLVAALDHCADNDMRLVERLMPVIQRVEKDKGPWVRAYCDARLRFNRTALWHLAKQPEALEQPPITLCMLSGLVDDSTAIALLREAQMRHPADLWINHDLANWLQRKAAGPKGNDFSDTALWEEVIAFRRVALAARPESQTLRGYLARILYLVPGHDDEAIAHYSRDIELGLKNPNNINGLYWALLQRGIRYSLRQQWDKALADWDKAIELDPKNVNAWMQKANYYSNLQQWDKVFGVWDKFVKLDPTNVFALACRANHYARQKQWDKALVDCSKVIELDLKYAQASQPTCYEKRASYYEILEQWDKALADYDKAIWLDPMNAGARCARGFYYADRKQWDKARADWEKAIELDPKNDRAWRQRASYYGNLQQWDKALGVWDKFVELDPKNARAWSGRGGYYTDRKQWDNALADFTRAIKLDPNNAGALSQRANCYDNLQQWDKALADWAKICELNPTNAFALGHRGLYYAKLKQWDKAITDCSIAIAMNPKSLSSFYWNIRAWAYYERKQWDKALADCSKAIDLEPKGSAEWGFRGKIYATLGQWNSAIADYSKAIELDPKEAGPHNLLAWLLATAANPRVRDPGRALNLAKKAVELAPKEGACWNTLGVAHYRVGDWKAALAAFAKSMELRNGGDSSDWFFMAMCHEKLGDQEKARQWYDRAVEWMDKNNPKDDELRRFRTEAAQVLAQAWFSRGVAHQKLRQWDKAVADYTKALELDPKHVSVWRARGEAHWQLGQRDKALADYSKVIELTPNDGPAWNRRGNAYRSLGLWDKAAADYTRALELNPKDVWVLYRRGVAHGHLGQCDKALADYSKAIELDPKFAAAHERLAWMLANCADLKLRDPRQAIAAAKKALELSPKKVPYWTTLAWAEYRAGNWQAAITAMEKFKELGFAGSSFQWFLLAMAHSRLGNNDEARRWYDRAVEWMDKRNPKDEELHRFRAEAAQVLGVDKKKD